MRTKLLRSQTIIPQELYVERGADAQLRQVVEDMGRPGYVLVARQMGKTNLLLNARRTLAKAENCFVYVDLSNQFPDIQSFLRNIVDIALESAPLLLGSASERVKKSRALNLNKLPHKEHEYELRELLRDFQGKLVICLDEIDALAKTDYSDQVFSLIRSFYFAGRVNFIEFTRLTYIFSGVAEPSEIIKNRDVSPFNIGEKIYLDDFTRDEFYVFLARAKLALDPAVGERIYFWTNGNPRMTWDVCSAVEDLILGNIGPTPKGVDDLVYRMYLVKFDLPPVDHIRTLAIDDSTIRDALISIHYGKSGVISDALRNKLYLAGIVSARADSRDIAIRNRILEEALSEKWLKEVERAKLSLRELADKRYENADFATAKDLYQQYLNESVDALDASLVEFRIGACLINLEQYVDAIAVLEKTPISKAQSSSAYYEQMYWLGLCYLIGEKYDACVPYFRLVLEQDPTSKDTVNYFDACLNMSSAYLRLSGENSVEIERLNQLVLDSETLLRKGPIDEKSINRYLYIAHYNLSRLHKANRAVEKATFHIVRAISTADLRSRVGLQIEHHDLAPTLDQRHVLLQEAVDFIVKNGLVLAPKRKEYPFDFTQENCIALFERIAISTAPSILGDLATYLVNAPGSDKAIVFDAITQAGYSTLTKSDVNAGLALFKLALGFPEFGEKTYLRRQIMTVTMLMSSFSEISDLEDKYVAEYLDSPSAFFLQTDFRLLYGLITGHLKHGNLSRAHELLKLGHALFMRSAVEDNPEIVKFFEFGVVIFNYLRLQIAANASDPMPMIEMGVTLRKQLEELPNGVPAYFSEDFLSQIRGVVKEIVQDKIRHREPLRRVDRKFGRNEVVAVKFKNGIIQKGKYKTFMQQISIGDCEIIDG